jgi:phosphoglycolate phosphatase
MKYKLVIFDFDGTLADSFPWFIQVVNSVAAKYNFKPIEEGEVERLRSFSARQLIKHLGVPLWKIPFIAGHMRRLLTSDAPKISPFVGVDDLLAHLAHTGITLALVTSNSLINVRQVLGDKNLSHFTYLECGISLFGKRAPFRKILKQSGARPHEVLAIGDELRDLEAATQERIPFGAVAWGFTTLEALQAHAPDEVFLHIEDIAAQLA